MAPGLKVASLYQRALSGVSASKNETAGRERLKLGRVIDTSPVAIDCLRSAPSDAEPQSNLRLSEKLELRSWVTSRGS